jgi:hypothetical protein
MELESSDLSDIPPPPQSDEFDSDDCDAAEIVCNISFGVSNAEGKNSSVSRKHFDSDPQINYFENDSDNDYDGSVSDALSDHSIDEEDSLNSPQHRDPPARSSSANTRMQHLHTLQTFVVILEAFGLRCAFDHWKRERNDEEDKQCYSSNNSSISTPRVLDASLDSHVEEDGSDNDNLDHSHDIMDHSSISSSSEILLHDLFLKESVNLARAFDVIDRVLSTASIRGALFVWAETSKRIYRKERLRLQWKMVEAQALLRRRRTLEKVLRSWRDVTLLTMKRRQKYFLMVLFNRWQLYTDECIDARQKRDTALLHWATFKIKKAFVILKLHAKQSQIAREEERKLATSLQRSSNRVGLTNEIDALRIHRFGKTSALQCYRSPALPTAQMSLPSRRIHDYCATTTRNWFDSIRPTSSMRQISPPLGKEFTTKSCVRPTKFYLDGMASPFSSQPSVLYERQTSSIAGSNSYFAHGIDPTTSRHISTLNSSANCLGFHERFITSCVLEEMISIVEHRHSLAAGAEQSLARHSPFSEDGAEVFLRR